MKKILVLIALAGLLTELVIPTLISAQEFQAQECAKLNRAIEIADVQKKDTVVQADGCSALTWTGDYDPPAKYTFKKGSVVGPRGGVCTLTPTPASKGGPDANNDCIATPQWGLVALLNTVYNVSNWIFYFIMVITVVMVAIGAFMYVSSAGDPEKAGKGQKLILYAVIGIAIAFFARAVPALVKFVMAI